MEALIEVHPPIEVDVATPMVFLFGVEIQSQINQGGEEADVEDKLTDHRAEVVAVPNHQATIEDVIQQSTECVYHSGQ